MGNLLQTRPAETTTAAAGTIGAIIAAAASHDYTTAVVLAVVSYLPAIITLLHLTANRPASSVIRVLEDLGVAAGLTRKPGENDGAYAERLSAAVHTLPGQLHVLVDGKPVAANITVAAPAPADTAHPGPLPTEAAPASTEQPPPIQGS